MGPVASAESASLAPQRRDSVDQLSSSWVGSFAMPRARLRIARAPAHARTSPCLVDCTRIPPSDARYKYSLDPWGIEIHIAIGHDHAKDHVAALADVLGRLLELV